MRPGARAGALVIYVLVAVLLFHDAWLHPQTLTAGAGGGDTSQAMWFFSWTPYALTHGSNPLFTDRINAPDGVNLMWNSAAPLLGLLIWPVRALFGSVVAYNTLLTLALALSAWCGNLAARHFGLRPKVALLTGLLYGFCPFLTAHALGHAKVSWSVLPPLLLIFMHEALVLQRRPAWRSGVYVGLLFAAQVLLFEEGVGLGAIAFIAGAAVLAILHRHEIAGRIRNTVVAAATAALTFGVVAGPAIAFQILGPRHRGGSLPGSDVYDVDLANLVLPTRSVALAPAAATGVTDHLSGNLAESGAYLGVAVLGLLLALAVMRRRDPLVRWIVATGCLVTLFAMGPNVMLAGDAHRAPLPWDLVDRVPLLGSAYPARLFIYVDLLGALGVGVLAEAVMAKLVATSRAARAAVGLAVVLALASYVPAQPFPASPVSVPSYFTGPAVAQIPEGATVLVAPFAHDGSDDAAMLWQTEAGMRFRMPEGYFINFHGSERADGPDPSATRTVMLDIAAVGGDPGDAERDAVRADLHRWGVIAILVGPMPHRAEMERFMERVAGTPAQEQDGVSVWRVDPTSW